MSTLPSFDVLRRRDLNTLLVLRRLLLSKSVSVTADQLGMSPSSVSKALAQLREDFQDQLLVRSSNKMFLTELAVLLLPQLEELVRHLHSLYEGSASLDDERNERVFVLGANDYVQATLGIRMAGLLSKSSPTVRLTMRPVATNLVQLLADGFIDLVVVTENLESRGLRSRVLNRERFVCVALAGASARAEPMAFDEFCAHAQADYTPSGNGLLQQLFETRLLDKGVKRNVRTTLSSIVALPGVLQQTDGICIVPERVLQVEAIATHLRVVPLAFELPTFELGMYWHNVTHGDPLARLIRDRLAAMFADAAGGRARG
ncbi:LysR family transcriptional regulator [Variovorax sp. KK3]|uniref:LysR family transcriptional regulator n=1 Tax=Variovorax sp. KK3 TaxID=1855728 RepID=UPI00097BB4B7|nr:LysR family transcriptional regulator [Variovorax sp. KK3]